MFDRRKYYRIKANIPCSIIINHNEYEAKIIDLSERGMKIRIERADGPGEIKKGDQVFFSFYDGISIDIEESLILDAGRVTRYDAITNEIGVYTDSEKFRNYAMIKKKLGHVGMIGWVGYYKDKVISREA